MNSNGKISEQNAQDVYQVVQRIYKKTPPLSYTEYRALSELRDHLSSIYAGDLYDPVMLTCVKIMANWLIDIQGQPDPQSERQPKVYLEKGRGGSNKVTDKEFYYCGKSINIMPTLTFESLGRYNNRSLLKWTYKVDFRFKCDLCAKYYWSGNYKGSSEYYGGRKPEIDLKEELLKCPMTT